ncbi:hypothetical protein BDV95DRAFT_480528 [Massariosphaeria phaeospora]|uniref:gamma-glutamylcyclotransferase n=1 Tax=Massariosphaeria phaeospora TaxID=100035 RepID=A0A7C8IFA3_9PLEO|nr:hypothetical protein BDV95DRAFT_480528 [Massariosphaeria phaeospora]
MEIPEQAASTPRWYFAYGSNLSLSVLTGKRGVAPQQSRVVRLPGYSLCFNVLFLPYSEPAMAGLQARVQHDRCQPVFGVAYLLSEADFLKVLVTEGAGVAYRMVETAAEDVAGKTLRVYTLIARHESPFAGGRYPSRRYLDLLLKGAIESKLPIEYQETLVQLPAFRPSNSTRWRVGQWTFQLVWHKISMWVQHGTRRFSNEQGEVPGWFLTIFDILLWLMWFHHDYIQAPVFGRGDGGTSTEQL